MRFMLAFRSQSELEALVGCVRRAMPRTFKRMQPALLTPRERKIRTEKLQGGQLTLGHSLLCQAIDN